MLEEVKVNDRYDVVIKNQDHFGNGIVKVKDKLIFVKNALPTEKCSIEITMTKKTFAEARVVAYKSNSDERCEVACPHYKDCGGCNIMHQTYEGQLKYKEEKIKEILKKFADITNIEINPIIPSNEFNYRNKVTLHFEKNKFGFYKEKSNSIVPIESCYLLDPMINTVMFEINDYLINNPKEEIYNMMIRTTSLNEIMVLIDGKIKNKLFTELLKKLGVTSFILNGVNLIGYGFVTEKIFEQQFQISPSSFFQVNYNIMLLMYKNVTNFYKEKGYSNVLDLYCGTGTIGMLLTPYVDKVVGIEVEKVAIIDAKNNKLINDIKNITFLKGKVEDKIDEFNNIDSIIVDPPRTGLDNKTLDNIIQINPETIVYISCDPVTLARDLKVLIKKYDILEITPFDMFPNTYHVETVVKLQRKNL